MAEVTTSDIRLFADGSLLYRHITSSQYTNIIQQDLTALETWETDWQMQMTINPEKCTVMHITHNKKPVITNYQLHGHTLEREHISKYLGITISEDLKWYAHMNNITTRANISLGFTRRNLRACKPPVKTAAYNAIMHGMTNTRVCINRLGPIPQPSNCILGKGPAASGTFRYQ